MKLSFVILVAIFYLTGLSDARSEDFKIFLTSEAQRPKPLPCSAIYRCTKEEDPVWTTDGYTCYVFINQCQLDLENCIREQAGIRPLEAVDQEKCQTICNPKCPECDKPVCGIHNCTLVNFPSLCWMDYYNCISGQVYTLNNYGPCKL